MIRLYTRLAGGALILAGVLVLIVLLTAFYGNFERKLSRLPDYDYIPDIRALMKEKKVRGSPRAVRGCSGRRDAGESLCGNFTRSLR